MILPSTGLAEDEGGEIFFGNYTRPETMPRTAGQPGKIFRKPLPTLLSPTALRLARPENPTGQPTRPTAG